MPLDAILLSALTEELSLSICEMRVDGITQPEKDVFIFALRKLANLSGSFCQRESAVPGFI